MDAARGPPPSAINGDYAAGGAFDKLRDVVRECEKGAAGFDHDHFSKEKLPGRDMTSTPFPFYWPNGWSRTSREQSGTSLKASVDLPLTRRSHFVVMAQQWVGTVGMETTATIPHSPSDAFSRS